MCVHGGHNARRRLEARRALICAVGMSRGQRRDLPTERVARRGRPPDGCVRPWSTAPSGGRAVLAPRRGSAHRVGHREPCCSDRPRFAQRPREPSDRTPRRIAPEGRRHVIDACVVDPVLLTFPTDDVARSQATDQVDGLLSSSNPALTLPFGEVARDVGPSAAHQRARAANSTTGALSDVDEWAVRRPTLANESQGVAADLDLRA